MSSLDAVPAAPTVQGGCPQDAAPWLLLLDFEIDRSGGHLLRGSPAAELALLPGCEELASRMEAARQACRVLSMPATKLDRRHEACQILERSQARCAQICHGLFLGAAAGGAGKLWIARAFDSAIEARELGCPGLRIGSGARFSKVPEEEVERVKACCAEAFGPGVWIEAPSGARHGLDVPMARAWVGALAEAAALGAASAPKPRSGQGSRL